MARRASFYPATLLAASLLATPLAAADPPKLGVFHRDVDGDGAKERIVIVNQMRPDGSLAIFARTYRPDGSVLSYEQKIFPPNADLTGDGIVDSKDLALVVGAWGGDGPADLNRDGVVDSEDLALVLGQFGAVVALPRSDCHAMGCVEDQFGNCHCGGGGGPNDPDDGDPNDPAGLPTTDVPTDGDDGGQNPGNHPPPGDGDPTPPPPPTVSVDDAPRCIGVWAPDDTDGDDTNDTDDLPTLTADGSDGGGTYSWTIIQDDDRVEFVDPDPDDEIGAGAGKTVILRGMKPSEEIDDVQIEVVHTSAEGAVSEPAMIELTVIAVALSFRPADPLADPPEVWSEHNDIAPQVAGGEPRLGRVTPLSPLGTAGFFTNMELDATFTPCLPELNCDANFLQLKQGWAIRQNADGSFTVDPAFSCSPGPNGDQWCNDDPQQDAQDLLLQAEEACQLFMVDRPGVSTGDSACGGALDGTRSMLCLRFRSWLEVDGFRASSTHAWRSTTEVSCDFGFWSMTADFFGNSLSKVDGAVCDNPDPLFLTGDLPTPSDPALTSKQPTRDVDVLTHELASDEHSKRSVAFLRLREMIEENAMSEIERARLINGLRPLAGRIRENYPPSSSTELAIWLLGELRAVEAIPVLLTQVDEKFLPRIIVRRGDEAPPAAQSLAMIGEPAILPILREAPRATDSEWAAMLLALRRIDWETPVVRQAARVLLELTADVMATERLRSVLQLPEPQRRLADGIADINELQALLELGTAPDAEELNGLGSALRSLESDNLLLRLRGYRLIRERLADSNLEELDKNRIERALTKICRVRPVDDETAFSQHELAVDLLVRANPGVESIRAIVDLVGVRFPDVLRRDLAPVVEALLSIGAPAVGPILERAGTATNDEWEQLHAVLQRIDRDTPAVRQAMETLLEVTDDETAKKRLEEFLATPEPRRPTPTKKQEQTKQTSDESVALGAQ